MFDIEMFSFVYEEVLSCGGVAQEPEFHPEGDVYNHSMQTVKHAFRESRDLDLVMAALLHDVGKVKGSKGHEQYGIEMLNGFVSVKTLWLIENHMRVWYYINGEMKRWKKAVELAEHPWLPQLIQLARWDKMGRNKNVRVNFTRVQLIDAFSTLLETRWKNLREQ